MVHHLPSSNTQYHMQFQISILFSEKNVDPNLFLCIGVVRFNNFDPNLFFHSFGCLRSQAYQRFRGTAASEAIVHSLLKNPVVFVIFSI